MSSDECWDLGLRILLVLNKSLDTFILYVDCWVAFTLFRMDFEVDFETRYLFIYYSRLFSENPF